MNNAARHAPYAHKTTKLVRHAHEEEPDELMLLATERYCHSEQFDRLTMRQYCEAFEILSPQIKRTTLQVIARSLASCPFAPRVVVMALALEPVNISRPLLMQSSVLGQLDMMRIIDHGTQHHATTLAERHDIGPTVVKRLLELQSDEIDKTLIDNPALEGVIAEAEEKRKSGKRSTELETTEQPADLVAQAKHEIENSEGVLSAIEFERQIVSELEAFPSAEGATGLLRAAAQRDQLAKDQPLESEQFETGAMHSEVAETDLMRAAARGGRLGESEQTTAKRSSTAPASAPVSEVAVANLANSLELISAAKSRQGMATLMSKASGFSLDTAFQVLEDTSGDTLAVFLKAHEIDAAAANRILMLTFPSVGLSTQNAMRAVRFYKTLEAESCADAVDQWPKEEAPRAVHQPYLDESGGVRWSARDNTAGERRDVELEETRREALG